MGDLTVVPGGSSERFGKLGEVGFLQSLGTFWGINDHRGFLRFGIFDRGRFVIFKRYYLWRGGSWARDLA